MMKKIFYLMFAVFAHAIRLRNGANDLGTFIKDYCDTIQQTGDDEERKKRLLELEGKIEKDANFKGEQKKKFRECKSSAEGDKGEKDSVPTAAKWLVSIGSIFTLVGMILFIVSCFLENKLTIRWVALGLFIFGIILSTTGGVLIKNDEEQKTSK